MTTLETVPTGPYFGFTPTDLDAELARYKTARQQSASRLTGASVNGQSYQFGLRGDWSLDEWQQAIQAAYYSLDPGRYPAPPPTNTAAIAFL